MIILIEIFIFTIGLFIGSFLNLIIDRLPNGKNIFLGRSHCDFCAKDLNFPDLIPVFSFLFLKGKCRYCKKFIGFKYPMIEIITGFLFLIVSLTFFKNLQTLLINWDFNFLPKFIFALTITSILIIIFFIDYFYGVIEDSVLIFTFLIDLFWKIYFKVNLLDFFLSGALSFIFFYAIYFFSKKKGMGFGDVKFAFLIGFLLGPVKALIAFYLAFLTGALVSFILILWKKKSLKKDTIPFGPFLAFATFILYFWEIEKIIIHILNP